MIEIKPINTETFEEIYIEAKTPKHKIDFNEKMPIGSLPHIGERGGFKPTVSNLKMLLAHYGIACEYNEISKEQRVILSNSDSSHDLSENSNYALLRSLLALNDMPVSAIDLLPCLMVENTVNPVVEFMTAGDYKAEKLDYFRILADSLVVDDSDKEYRDLALKTWFMQCVAAADYATNSQSKGSAKFELVLVLQGGQGIGKSTWLKNLLPTNLSEYFAENEHLDPNDVNSLRRCLSSWICEIGELDATFRKADMERLKAFLSQSVDKIRLPYDRSISNYKRRTSFCATVNTSEFLVDRTGNRRFIPIALKNITPLSLTDDQRQLFWAQMWYEYSSWRNPIWWASDELENMLIERHAKHSETSAIDELIAETFDMTTIDDSFAKHHTVTRILSACGVNNPTKNQMKEAKAFIEKAGFKQKTVQGSRGYNISRRLND